MNAKHKLLHKKISFKELFNSLRLPVAQRSGQAFKSKKEYNRKDNRWKNDW